MVDIQGLERISDAIETFSNGEPMHFEIDLAEGVWLEFDCPYLMDLSEPTITVSVGIEGWSPHNEGEPEEPCLMDYSDFADELTANLDAAFYNGGSRNEEVVFEYSEYNNPQSDCYVFIASINNPRAWMADNHTAVNEERA